MIKCKILKRANLSRQTIPFLKERLAIFALDAPSETSQHIVWKSRTLTETIDYHVEPQTIDEKLFAMEVPQNMAEFEVAFDIFKNTYLGNVKFRPQRKNVEPLTEQKMALLMDRMFFKMGIIFLLMSFYKIEEKNLPINDIEYEIYQIDVTKTDCITFWSSYIENIKLPMCDVTYLDALKERLLNIANVLTPKHRKTSTLRCHEVELLTSLSSFIRFRCPKNTVIPRGAMILNRTSNYIDIELNNMDMLTYLSCNASVIYQCAIPLMLHLYKENHWVMLYAALRSMYGRVISYALDSHVETHDGSSSIMQKALVHLIEHKQWFSWTSERAFNTLFGVVFSANSYEGAKTSNFYFNGETILPRNLHSHYQRENICSCLTEFIVIPPGSFSDMTFAEIMELETTDEQHPLAYLCAMKNKPYVTQFFYFAFLCYHKYYTDFASRMSNVFYVRNQTALMCDETEHPLIHNALLQIHCEK